MDSRETLSTVKNRGPRTILTTCQATEMTTGHLQTLRLKERPCQALGSTWASQAAHSDYIGVYFLFLQINSWVLCCQKKKRTCHMQHTLQLNLANMHNLHLHLHSWKVNPSWGPDKSRRTSQPTHFFWDPEHLGQGEGRWFSQELQGTGKTSPSHPDHQSLSQNSLPTSLL